MDYKNSMNNIYVPPHPSSIYPTTFPFGSNDFSQNGPVNYMTPGRRISTDYPFRPLDPSSPINYSNAPNYPSGGVWVPVRYVTDAYGTYLSLTDGDFGNNSYPNIIAVNPVIIPQPPNIQNTIPFYTNGINDRHPYSSYIPSPPNSHIELDTSDGYGHNDVNTLDEAYVDMHLSRQLYQSTPQNLKGKSIYDSNDPRKYNSENYSKRKEKQYKSLEEKHTSDSGSANSTPFNYIKGNKNNNVNDRYKHGTKKITNLPLSLLQRFSKTKMCVHQSEGSCTRGEGCPFAHTQNEIRLPPNLYKTKLCEYIKDGECPAGDDCRFAHSEKELRSTPEFYKTSICTLFEAGDCPQKENCRFAHGAHELRQRAHNLNKKGSFSNPIHSNDETYYSQGFSSSNSNMSFNGHVC